MQGKHANKKIFVIYKCNCNTRTFNAHLTCIDENENVEENKNAVCRQC